jgi:hypothetical protein
MGPTTSPGQGVEPSSPSEADSGNAPEVEQKIVLLTKLIEIPLMVPILASHGKY